MKRKEKKLQVGRSTCVDEIILLFFFNFKMTTMGEDGINNTENIHDGIWYTLVG